MSKMTYKETCSLIHIPEKKQATKTACENDQMGDLTKIFK